MDILVTGAKGFVGSSVVRSLLADSRVASVVCLDMKGTYGRLEPLRDRITLLSGGVGDVDDMVAIMREHRIDAVAHMVYFAADPHRPEQMAVEIDTIGRTTATVLEAARVAGVRRVVLPSSIHYYGPQWRHGQVALHEGVDHRAASLYGVGKAFIEAMARTYDARTSMDVLSFRIPVVYGPGAKVGARGVNVPAAAAATGEPGTVPYGPDDRVCVAHVDDVGQILCLGLTRTRVDHGVYNIGGHTVTYRQLGNFARAEVADVVVNFDDGGAPIELPYLIDDARVRAEFGFEHRPLEPAYRELIRAMQP